MDVAQSAISPDNFSIVAVFLRADWVVKGVLIGLAFASIWSWTVIIDKAFRFTALNREAGRFENLVSSGQSLEDIAKQAGDTPRHALPQMLQSALRDWRDGRARAGAEGHPGFLLERIERGLESIVARESARVEEGLGALAIVATASPFIGLFGTVWGIMNAFQAIAVQKNTNLSVVAPAISQALFATAVGLGAAIPAYIAYNKFSTDAAKYAGRLETFSDDLWAAVARRLAERA
ncbi:MAG TPA: protein TolQ [Caulobacteraceae bacterium]|jgi:biopolymer transport protein TolQ|nr:protein TolQ [Caulobacteraceae bacterium]